MTVSIKHKFVSDKLDDADSSLVRPSNWNDDHDLIGLGTAAESNVEDFASAVAETISKLCLMGA